MRAWELLEGKTQPPGDQVPCDRSHKRPEYHGGIDDLGCDDSCPYRLCNVNPEEQERDKIEERSPGDGIVRSQYAGRDDGRNRVCSVVHAVQGIEEKRDRDQRKESEGAKCSIHAR
jgi:hypothetical protein